MAHHACGLRERAGRRAGEQRGTYPALPIGSTGKQGPGSTRGKGVDPAAERIELANEQLLKH